MGQCQMCTRPLKDEDSVKDDDVFYNESSYILEQQNVPAQKDRIRNAVDQRAHVKKEQRTSDSSYSSGKASLHDSVFSCSSGQQENIISGTSNSPQLEDVTNKEDCLYPLQNITHSRKHRGRIGSAPAVVPFIRGTLLRTASLPPTDDEEELPQRRPRRAVSLRLPPDTRKLSLQGAQGSDQSSRRSSLQMALSLLSLNSLLKQDGSAKSSTKSNKKPVQKILRPPTKRQHVRGVSGLAINSANQTSRQYAYYQTNSNPRTMY